MKHTNLVLIGACLVLSGCALTQKPVAVSDSVGQSAESSVGQPMAEAPAVATRVEPTRVPPVVTPSHASNAAPTATMSAPTSGLTVEKLGTLARLRQKNPAGLKHYLGQTVHGQAKFVKTAKGNPNAAVADVHVSGVGDISLWCRHVEGGAVPGRMTGFAGTLTGEVYTSEDFSNDVYLKDCRFRD